MCARLSGPVFDLFGLGDGQFIKNSLTQRDIARIDAMEIKSHATGILRRKRMRAIKKGYSYMSNQFLLNLAKKHF